MRLAEGWRSALVEDVELGRRRGGAEGQREAAAPVVVMQPVEDTSRELVLTDENALDLEPPPRLVEPGLVRPCAAVDVVVDDVAVVVGVIEPGELADALVTSARDRNAARSRRAARDRGSRACRCPRRGSRRAGSHCRSSCSGSSGCPRAGSRHPPRARRWASRTGCGGSRRLARTSTPSPAV